MFFATDTGATTYFDGANWRPLTQVIPEDGPSGVATMRTLGPGDRQAAPGDDPRFTEVPDAPAGSNDTTPANTAFVQSVKAEIIGGAPLALDTLAELSAALRDNVDFAATITNLLADKLSIDRPSANQIRLLREQTALAWAPLDIRGAINQHDAGSVNGFRFWSGTQAEYDAIGNPSNTTLYFIE